MIPVIIGPTAVGKSSLSVNVAEYLIQRGQRAEVINLDSMLVYRGMDIGTAKPTVAERGRVPHHLIDILDIRQTATVADFQTLARDCIAQCQQRGATPILVGGSALYTRAVLDEFSFPGTDSEVRAHWESELARLGGQQLHDHLATLDPDAAAEILPGNGRRVVRALEVIQLTGKPYRASLPQHTYALAGVCEFGLDSPRDWLDHRIAQRVQQMWEEGFVAEVVELESRGLREGVTASKALGYRQILDFLAGEFSEQEAHDRTVAATRRFARKQYGWYRRDDRIQWLDARRDDLVAAIGDAVLTG